MPKFLKYLSPGSHFLIGDMALKLFRGIIIMHGSVQPRILESLLELIRQERSGANIEKGLLRSIIRMYSDLDLYHSHFEEPFVRQSEVFYDEEGQALIQSLNISDYLMHVHRRVEEEEERIKIFLAGLTRASLMSVLNTELISKRLPFLLSSLSDLILEHRFKELRLLYHLLSRIDNGISSLRTEFKSIVMRVGSDIVDNPENSVEKDREMIQRLLKWRDTLTDSIREGFSDVTSFSRAVQDAFEEFINRRQNKPAEYLAKYLDNQLRSSNRAQSEYEFDRLIDKILVVFRCIDGKDVFRAFYSNQLARRLLLGRSASVDAEKAVLSRLKHECGFNYTRKMELMFQDIQLSLELSRSFRAHQTEIYAIDFTVNVLAPGSWPEMPTLVANYPSEMLAIREDFEKFYIARHHGRKLTYIPSFGTCVVRAQFPSCTKELQVSEIQALVLLQFNGPADEPVSYTSIAEATGIEKSHLDRALLSFTASRTQRVLTSVPLARIFSASIITPELTEKTQFLFNKKFTHHLTRIRFNQLQIKESAKEQRATESRIFADRVNHIDCCVVRIMKSRKTLDHNSLISETFQLLKFPVTQTDVKKRIEFLIGKDYLRRDPANSAIYHYVA
ncbi:Cullin-4A [Taenia solium]|eukprot:TsM_000947600 transcript=TsM_000947600 gene=TsM_000947600